MIYTCTINTPLGSMTAAAKDDALIGLWFIGQKYYPSQTANWIREPDYPIFKPIENYLTRYFSGKASVLDIRLAPHGSSFQKMGWGIILKIPMGQVAAYGQIAKYIAQTQGLASMSARAVGGAVGYNPISILIPCHRVVGFSRKPTGYAGGLDKKAALLRIEKVNLERVDLRVNGVRFVEEKKGPGYFSAKSSLSPFLFNHALLYRITSYFGRECHMSTLR